jgi:tetrahydromethanopterin S-methyltransferase subunit G
MIILASTTGDAATIVWGLVCGLILCLAFLAVKNRGGD